MYRILFVCHGNICRSPMAEFYMRDLTEKAGLRDKIQVSSAATSTEELGCSVYPPAKRKLKEHGIDCIGKTARQINRSDYDKYDVIIGMDNANIRNMMRIFGGDRDGKIHLLLDFTGAGGEVDDPWYSGDFDLAWADIVRGCDALLRRIVKDGAVNGAG